ncbi:TonB-dependent receptor plug domain-containing protein [Novosphingobium beihaiensis]|uniref:TonB-dependent receptor n=1 Tax=Novosphingobium beihaiensis TaxID=2930389 RepID=A0ABT0BQP9_9SPHN|nr:TonB-dependent receptor [Novosphingobium beihaiensis]MCJ2187004.1 TonB-dependent receptor [Novosphingobium beihaiensis]
MRQPNITKAIGALSAALALFVLPAPAQPQEPAAVETAAPSQQMDELLGMSLEDILSQEVTSVAKKAQHVADAPAAVYVVSQDQISRSGARTLADLLRRVPGMDVFELQGSTSTISARGFSSRFASNLLVMVDGAAIYNTAISGMFWDQAIFPLQDIERIEVIRGPGGTLWGSNSINGVINIITKQSVDTQGLRLNLKAGTRDVRTEAGYGAQLSPSLGVRLYGTYRHSKGLQLADGQNIGDKWNGALGGVRLDYAPSDNDSAVVLAEVSGGHFTETITGLSVTQDGPVGTILHPRSNFNSEHVLARWKHGFTQDFDLVGQVYYNRLHRTEFDAGVTRELYDASLEGHWRLNSLHDVNFGISGRIAHDTVSSSRMIRLENGANTDHWLTGYLQDEIALVPGKLALTAGSKFEVNDFSGFQAQPSLRLFYRYNDSLAFWAAASHAVRTPLLQQRKMDANLLIWQPDTPRPEETPLLFILRGNKDVRVEELTSFEAGARASLSRSWSLDLSFYRNRYSHLVTAETVSVEPLVVPPFPGPVGTVARSTFGNNGTGRSWGFELVLSGQITPQWKTELSYSYLDLHVETETGGTIFPSFVVTPADSSSNSQLRATTSYDIGDKISLGGSLHYVSKSIDGVRPAFTDLDLRAAYRPRSNIEIAVTGSHLLQDRRLEFYEDYVPLPLGYVPRTVTLETRVRF